MCRGGAVMTGYCHRYRLEGQEDGEQLAFNHLDYFRHFNVTISNAFLKFCTKKGMFPMTKKCAGLGEFSTQNFTHMVTYRAFCLWYTL